MGILQILGVSAMPFTLVVYEVSLSKSWVSFHSKIESQEIEWLIPASHLRYPFRDCKTKMESYRMESRIPDCLS